MEISQELITLIYVLISFLGIGVILFYVGYFVFGGFIPKEIQRLYMELEDVELRINSLDPDIMYVNQSPYISTMPFTPLCNYYISGLGIVPIWSPLDKKISEWFKEARKEHKQQKLNEIKNRIK